MIKNDENVIKNFIENDKKIELINEIFSSESFDNIKLILLKNQTDKSKIFYS